VIAAAFSWVIAAKLPAATGSRIPLSILAGGRMAPAADRSRRRTMWFESPVLIAAAFFWMIAAVTKIVMDNGTKRRLLQARVNEDVVRALFRKGYDPELFSALKWGLVMATLGLGLVIVQLLGLRASEPLALGVMLVCAGSGMLAYYLVATTVLKADPRGRFTSPPDDAPRGERFPEP
jgi:hypothetical protein